MNITYVESNGVKYVVDQDVRKSDNSFVRLALISKRRDLHDLMYCVYAMDKTAKYNVEIACIHAGEEDGFQYVVWPKLCKLVQSFFASNVGQSTLAYTLQVELSSFDISVNEDAKPGRQIVLRYDQVSSNGRLGYGLPAMSVRELIRLHDTIDAWLVEFRKRGTI